MWKEENEKGEKKQKTIVMANWMLKCRCVCMFMHVCVVGSEKWGERCSVNESFSGVNRGREREGRRGCTEALWGDEYSCAERQREMHK